MNKGVYIGVDLGGTKIMIGVVDDNGEVMGNPIKIPTRPEDPANVLIARITGTIEKLITELHLGTSDIRGIGIGSTGPLDLEKGLVLKCLQLPNMHFFPLRDAIHKHFGLPVYINNDANCLILAECIFGAARNYSHVAGFTLGTGIGSALVFDKKIFSGATGSAGEIWPSPYCDGNIEDMISGSGVEKIYWVLSGQRKSSLEIYDLARHGDTIALTAWQQFGEHLAVPLSWTINIIDPEIIVLGGSITAAYPFFESSMKMKINQYICPVPAEHLTIVLAQLGGNAGFIGAACLAMNHEVPKSING